MYFEPLTKTSVEILAHLSSKIRQQFTVRQIAKAIEKDYKITYTMTMRLSKQKYIIAEKKRPVTQCTINLKGNSALLAYLENIRANDFFTKQPNLEIVTNEISAKIASPFYTMILFGSYIKGTATRNSDIDILFIIPAKSSEREVTSAIGSFQHVSPMGIHEILLTTDEFAELLKENKPNVAWEVVDSRIVIFGAQAFFKMLETVL